MFTATPDCSEYWPAVAETKKELLKQTVRAADDAAEAGRDHAKAVGAFADHTRHLRDHIYARPAIAKGDGAEAMIEATEDYARLVEEGHGPHPIYPKAGRGTMGPLRRGQSRGRSKAGTDRLVFRVGGRLVFAKMVNHPGARAYPFMGPAAEKAERVLFMKLERIDVRLQRIWR